MKKIVCGILSTMMVISMAACTQRNTAQRTNPGQINQNNQVTPIGLTGNVYKDGIYTGQGDKTGHGNELADVTIRNGRIVDIRLRRVDTQGKEIAMGNINNYGTTYGQNTATGTNSAVGTNTGTNNRNTTGITTAETNRTTRESMGGTSTGGTYGTTYGTPGTTSGTIGGTGTTGTTGTGYAVPGTIINNSQGTTVPRTNSIIPGTNTGTTPGTTYSPTVPGGNATGGGITANLGQTRTYLVNQMIQAQTWDVKTSTVEDTDVVNNWKLAARRALDKARK